MPDAVEQIIQRLSDSGAFADVSAAIDAQAVLSQRQIAGQAEAWVIELSTYPSQNLNADIGAPLQLERQQIAVIMGIRHANDKDGSKAKATLSSKREAVRAALYGFIPDSDNQSFTPLVLDGSRLMALDAPVTFWAEIFSTTHLIDGDHLL